ncbi:hypothetical protein [Geminisphaera colitermitum]|uniref:hypothetical protein n=1 Tax=Geminisphaera colitermitum TaxID=1148786 RepID=UPI000158D154|nr:hypothetical protein [Geminisphaera colitermitum]
MQPVNPQSPFILVTGWDGFPLHIDARRIMSVKAHVDSTPESPRCMVNMSCERESEEWNLRTPADTLLATLHDINPLVFRPLNTPNAEGVATPQLHG